MTAVLSPTVLLPVGSFGRGVAARVRERLTERESLLREHDLTDLSGLTRALDELLRVGNAHALAEAPRLDLLLLVDLGEGVSSLLTEVSALTTLIAQRYGSVFLAHAPPEQRTVGLHLVAAVPPLVQSPATSQALGVLRELEAWSQSQAAHPLLARVWLVPSQTSAGVLSAEDVVSSAAGFIVAMVASGVRHAEPVRARMSHPPAGEGLLGFAAVATLDVPSARLRSYLALRACYDALTELSERVQAASPGTHPGVQAPTELLAALRLDPFTGGPPAQQLRTLAWRQAGGAALSEGLQLGPESTAEGLRSRHAALFRPSFSSEHRAASDEPLRAALAELDEAESAAVGEVQRAVSTLLSDQLGHVQPLERVPEVELGLMRLRALQEDAQRADQLAALPSTEPATARGEEPTLAALLRAVDELPSEAARRRAAFAVGLGVTVLVTLVVLALSGGGGAAVTGLSSTVVSTTAPAPAPASSMEGALPWLAGLCAGALAAAATHRAVAAAALQRVHEALKARHEALGSLRADASSSRSSQLAEQRLRQHRVRIRRELVRGCGVALGRIQTLRAALHETREAIARRLEAIGVSPQPEATRDDLRRLLGEPTRLHLPLVGADAVRRWVSAGQRVVDGERWSDRIVRYTWPHGGLERDVPCADPDAVLSAVSAALTGVGPGSLFDDEAAAHEAAAALSALAPRVAPLLAVGCTPRTVHGDPAPGRREGELFTVAPASASAALTGPLTRLAVRAEAALWGTLEAPVVLLVRTWEGYRVEDVARGCAPDPRRSA